MRKLFVAVMIACAIPAGNLMSQTLYVDPVKGRDNGAGSVGDPLSSLDKAVTLANDFSGKEPVTIRLYPGVYVLTRQLLIQVSDTVRIPDTEKYTIEAVVMPDDTGWQPSKMPVIQSVSVNNKNYGHFDHCMAVQVERSNTSFRGLKFLGNTNPGVSFFYGLERHRPDLKNMEVSQCYFIGDKNSAPIQGAIFAQGSGIRIDHCIFYGCKNAVLVFQQVRDFSLTHSIIYGAYEGAFWFGYGPSSDIPFTFSDNVVADGNFFFIGDKGTHPNYAFRNSLITGNAHYMGFNGMEIGELDNTNKPREDNVRKSGKVLLNEVTSKGVPRDYLHLAPGSAGRDIKAGIFR